MVKTRPFLSHLTRHTWPFWTSNGHISIRCRIRQQYLSRVGIWKKMTEQDKDLIPFEGTREVR